MVVGQRFDDTVAAAAAATRHAVAGRRPVGNGRRAVRRRLRRHPVNGRRHGRLMYRRGVQVRLIRRPQSLLLLLLILTGRRRVGDGSGQRLEPLEQLRLELLLVVGRLRGMIEVKVEVDGLHVIGGGRPVPRRRRRQVR